ncbi:uncharacterized protein [Centruroides vittatus]|uniref:uncharacterized protein n=1 Tax=Centruroides vittatus TaxID=120091 RepID=UPI00350F39C6
MAVSSNKKRKTETNTSFPDDFKAIQFLKSKIPSNLVCLNFSEVNGSDKFISSYIIGKVTQSWPISERIKKGYLLKIMISEANSNFMNFEEAKLTVFLFDKFASEANPVTINSFIAFCGFTTENLTTKDDTNVLPYQVLVKPAENSKIWILKRREYLRMNNHHQSHPVNASKSRTYVYNTLQEAIEEYNIDPNKRHNVYGLVTHCEIVFKFKKII